jgi:hypothetical protein
MILVSLLTAAALLLIFRVSANPSAIRRRKDRLIARVLELALFKDDIVVNLGAFGRVLSANALYLGTLLKPLCLSIVPMILLMIQADAWFSGRPFRPGETALVSAKLADGVPVADERIMPESSKDIVEQATVRIPERNEIVWRMKALAPGDRVNVLTGGGTVRKTLVVGDGLAGLSRNRLSAGFWRTLLNPVEPPLPNGCPLASVTVQYPPRDFVVLGMRMHWLVAYLVLTLAFAWFLKRPLRVEI